VTTGQVAFSTSRRVLLEPKRKRDRLFPRRQVHARADFIPSIERADLRGEKQYQRVRLHQILDQTAAPQPRSQHAKMVYLDTMEEWQRQAKLLFQARPATVRKSTTHRLLAGQQR
jgi:hypothetical protein